jgi:hypothetical protein
MTQMGGNKKLGPEIKLSNQDKVVQIPENMLQTQKMPKKTVGTIDFMTDDFRYYP